MKDFKDNVISRLERHKRDYQMYRGSSFDEEGNVLWMKEDVESYCDGIDVAIKIITEEYNEIQNKE